MKAFPILVHIMTVSQSLAFLNGQVGYMKTQGFDVHAISSPGKLADDFTGRESIIFHPVKMQRRITPFSDLGAIFRIWHTLKKLRPQIVHSHTPKGGVLGMIGAFLAGVPVRIYHLHGLPMLTAKGYKRVLLWGSDVIACAFATQILCVSQSLREEVIKRNICSAEKIKVLLHGSINGVAADTRFNPDLVNKEIGLVTRAQYDIAENDLVLGFVGRIVRDKGIIELVKAWEKLREEFPQLHFLMVGSFEPYDPLPTNVKELIHSDSRIHLSGYSNNVESLYSAMDILVLPSYREGLGGVTLEAAAMRIPVVATRIPGCVDSVVDGVTGTLVPPRDALALAEAIRIYLNEPELRCEHGKAGRVRVLRNFRPEAMWKAIYQEYARLLREKGLPLPEPHPLSV